MTFALGVKHAPPHFKFPARAQQRSRRRIAQRQIGALVIRVQHFRVGIACKDYSRRKSIELHEALQYVERVDVTRTRQPDIERRATHVGSLIIGSHAPSKLND